MNDFYAKLVLTTKEPIKNTDDLLISFDTIEFQIPELLRLDFSKTKRYVRKKSDGFCEIELYGYEFNYDTFKSDYEKLNLSVEDFDADYFDSILNDYLKVTEVIVNCTDRKMPERVIPLSIDKVQLVFETEMGEKVIDFTFKITNICREKLLVNNKDDMIPLIRKVLANSEYRCFCESFAKALFDSICTDEESLEKIGYYLLKAIEADSFDDFFVAICGWSLDSLMKKAHIVPDKDLCFYDEVIDAKYVTLWTNCERFEGECKVNTKTRKVFNIEYDASNLPDDAECVVEFVSINNIDFPVVPKDEFESGNDLAFWYGEDE